MSSNLPPGVTTSMIPGNRPEDIREEAFWDEVWDRIYNKANILPPDVAATFVLHWDDPDHWIIKVIEIVRDMAYTEGMNDGRMEEQMAQGSEECYRCHYAHPVSHPCVVD